MHTPAYLDRAALGIVVVAIAVPALWAAVMAAWILASR